jgi:hypothetical protein
MQLPYTTANLQTSWSLLQLLYTLQLPVPYAPYLRQLVKPQRPYTQRYYSEKLVVFTKKTGMCIVHSAD